MASPNKRSGNAGKQTKGDTSRTSNQGQKLSSGGRKDTDNRGRPSPHAIDPKEEKAVKSTGRKL